MPRHLSLHNHGNQCGHNSKHAVGQYTSTVSLHRPSIRRVARLRSSATRATHRTIATSSTSTHHHEVRTSDPRRITGVNNDRLVAKETLTPHLGRQERIRVISHKVRNANFAVLASKIADLASARVGCVAGVVLAAVRRVQVAHRGAAVAILGHGEVVDVVDEGSVFCDVSEAVKVDVDEHAGCVGAGGDGYGACDCVSGAVVD